MVYQLSGIGNIEEPSEEPDLTVFSLGSYPPSWPSTISSLGVLEESALPPFVLDLLDPLNILNGDAVAELEVQRETIKLILRPLLKQRDHRLQSDISCKEQQVSEARKRACCQMRFISGSHYSRTSDKCVMVLPNGGY